MPRPLLINVLVSEKTEEKKNKPPYRTFIVSMLQVFPDPEELQYNYD